MDLYCEAPAATEDSEGWKPCRRMMSGMSRVFVICQRRWAGWMGESAAAASFIFIQLFPVAFVICLEHTCWVPPSDRLISFNSMFYFPKCTAHGRCAYARVPPSPLCFCWTGCRKKKNHFQLFLDSKETFTFELQQPWEKISADILRNDRLQQTTALQKLDKPYIQAAGLPSLIFVVFTAASAFLPYQF